MPTNNVTRFIKEHAEKDIHYINAWTKDGFNHLRTYLGNVEKGQPKVYTAPFAKGDSMEEILKDWESVLVSIQDEWPSLMDFENDLAKKVGPLSVQQPLSNRLEDIAHYYDDILLSSKPIDERAISATCNEFAKIGGLRVRSQKETVEKMKKSTNSGAPYFTKRRNVIQETTPCSVFWFSDGKTTDAIQRLPGFKFNLSAPAVIGWRGQEGGPQEEDVKQRVVWMFPFGVNICELQVYQPLIEAAQATNLVPAWVSMESVDQRITDLFDTKSKDDLVVCTDFSRFDQHFNKDMNKAAYQILTHILTPNYDSKTWLFEVFPIKYLIPLVIGAEDDAFTVVSGEHGMASGSGGTNCDETLVHRALQYEAAILSGEKLNPNSMCLGDDGILTYPGINVEDVVKAYESHGQECNPDKQYASTQDCVYLRRWHHTNYRVNGVCVGVYSTNRALGRLRYLERFMDPEYWSPQLVALRQLSIIENCKWHPLFHQFIEFCMKRDKYRLGIDIPGFLDNIEKYAQESIEVMPDFLGYTKSFNKDDKAYGIANWWIVQYLKSKA